MSARRRDDGGVAPLAAVRATSAWHHDLRAADHLDHHRRQEPTLDTDPDAPSWDQVLAAMEQGLSTFDDALADTASNDDGPPVLPAWEPPSNLGPLPVHLLERATSVLGRLEDAQGRARAGLTRLQAESGDVDRRREASSAYADHAG